MRFSPACDCCEDEVGNCGVCSINDMPDCFEVTIAGVNDLDCTQCDIFNGTHKLLRTSYLDGINCVWSKKVGEIICIDPNDPSHILKFNNVLIQTGWTRSIQWFLMLRFFSFGSTVIYDPPEEFDCNGPNTFTFSHIIGGIINFPRLGYPEECQGYPAEIIVTPSSC